LDTHTVDLPKQPAPYYEYTGDRGKGTNFLVFISIKQSFYIDNESISLE